LGHMNVVCPDCGARHWKAEQLSKSKVNQPVFGTCCLEGKVELPPVRAPPRDLLQLFDGTSNYSQDFKRNIRAYNSAFALASLGVTVDRGINNGNSPYVFKIQGALYHNVGSPLPEPQQEPCFAQLYFISSAEANDARTRYNPLNNHIMGILDNVLKENHAYVRVFKTAIEWICEQQRDHPNFVKIVCEKETDPRRYDAPTANEVAVILPGDGSQPTSSRDLIV
ncbi:hypothetical protein B0H19DRAFT_910883, partial [Mycena capillaripes]